MRGAELVGLALAVGLATLSCSRAPTGPNDTMWRLLPGHVESLTYAPFRNGRQCWVYLPPGYQLSDKRYPVLYLTDGESDFDAAGAMHVNRICEDLIRSLDIEPIIVIAIENGPSPQRTIDLTPWPAPYWVPNGGGDLFARAIRDTLKPEVDRRFRTLPDPANTAISGVSLGGLFATYVGYVYDETFGKVGAFSPTYLWENDTIYAVAKRLGRPPRLTRFYVDTGYPEDNDITGMESIALSQGFIPGLDLQSVTVPGATHSHRAWEHRYPQMLKFLFGR